MEREFNPFPWIAVVAVLSAGAYWRSLGPVPTPDGPLVREVPQIYAVDNAPKWVYKNSEITPVAQLSLRARVLSRERYFFDQSADLSPIDLALGWRGMSDNHYLRDVKITQGGRWYFFEMGADAIPAEIISEQSKNVHVIPARPDVWSAIKAVRPGQILRAKGFLVDIYGPNAFRWNTYRSTGGTGNGSCWIFWVESFVVE